jgi:hypothetical protein
MLKLGFDMTFPKVKLRLYVTDSQPPESSGEDYYAISSHILHILARSGSDDTCSSLS